MIMNYISSECCNLCMLMKVFKPCLHQFYSNIFDFTINKIIFFCQTIENPGCGAKIWSNYPKFAEKRYFLHQSYRIFSTTFNT